MILIISIVIAIIVIIIITKNKKVKVMNCLPMSILYKHKNGKINEYMCYPCDTLPVNVSQNNFITCDDLFKKLKQE